jgi:hypothetical protein
MHYCIRRRRRRHPQPDLVDCDHQATNSCISLYSLSIPPSAIMLGFFQGFLSSQPVPLPLTGFIPSSASLLIAEMNRITDEAMLEWELGEAEREQKHIDMEEGLCRCVQQEVEKEIQRRFSPKPPLEHVPRVGRAKASILSSTGAKASTSSSTGASSSSSLSCSAKQTFPPFYHESDQVSATVSSPFLPLESAPPSSVWGNLQVRDKHGPPVSRHSSGQG